MDSWSSSWSWNIVQVANGTGDFNLEELVGPLLWASTKMISCYIYTSIINKSSLCGQISKRVNWWTIRDSQQFCPIWIKGRTCSSAASLFFTQTLVSNPQGSQDLGRLQSQATRKGGRRAGSDRHYPPFGTEQVDANRNVKCGTIHKAVCGYSP